MIVFGNKKFDEPTLSEIESIIDGGVAESLLLEFKKQPTSNSKEIAKEVSSMANSEGGIIIYGINEDEYGKASEICWLNASEKFPERFENIIASTVNPTPDFRIKNISHPEDKSREIYVVFVSRSKNFHMVTENNDNRYYRRMGRTIKIMEPAEMLERSRSIDSDEKLNEVIKGLDDEFSQNSGQNINEEVFISYYIIPDSLQKFRQEDIKNEIKSLDSDRFPILGTLRDSYQSSVSISNYRPEYDEFWQEICLVHPSGIVELRTLVLDKCYRSGIEFGSMGRLISWAAELLKGMKYFGGFTFIMKTNAKTYAFPNSSLAGSGYSKPKRSKPIAVKQPFTSVMLSEEEIKDSASKVLQQIGLYWNLQKEIVSRRYNKNSQY